jgi:hypothetical protein
VLLTYLHIPIRVQQNVSASERLVFIPFIGKVDHASDNLLQLGYIAKYNTNDYLSNNSRKLLIVRISRRPDYLPQGNWHMLEDIIEVSVGCASFKGGDNVLVLKLSKQVQCLCRRVGYKCSPIGEVHRKVFPNSHFHNITKFNVIDLLILLLRGFPRNSELEGATRHSSSGPRMCLPNCSRGIRNGRTAIIIRGRG